MTVEKETANILAYFAGRPEVVTLFLFGTFATPREGRHSDIDLAVLLDPGKMHGRQFEDFRADYYRASPHFSLRSVDMVILNTAPSALKHEILRTGRILMDKDPCKRKRFTARALVEYFDYRFVEGIYFAALRKRLEESYGKPERDARRKIGRIEEHLRRIRAVPAKPVEAFREDTVSQDIILFNVTQAIQGCIDIAAHIIGDEAWGIPATQGATFEILGEKGVLSTELVQKLIAMSGFGGRIVHDYEHVDLDIVYAVWRSELPDIERFCLSVIEHFRL